MSMIKIRVRNTGQVAVISEDIWDRVTWGELVVIAHDDNQEQTNKTQVQLPRAGFEVVVQEVV